MGVWNTEEVLGLDVELGALGFTAVGVLTSLGEETDHFECEYWEAEDLGVVAADLGVVAADLGVVGAGAFGIVDEPGVDGLAVPDAFGVSVLGLLLPLVFEDFLIWFIFA